MGKVHLQDGTTEIDITKKEEFITDYNRQPARHYKAIETLFKQILHCVLQ